MILVKTIQKLLLQAYILALKLILPVYKLLGKGRATAWPGLIIEKYFSNWLSLLTNKYQQIILVTGTNGKTTTRALLTTIYKHSGRSVTTNLGGANIIRGLASTLLQNSKLNLEPKNLLLILEVEEASLPKLAKYIRPHKLVFTNIFRDQLDANTELDTTIEHFKNALKYFQTPLAYKNKADKIKVYANYNDYKLQQAFDFEDFSKKYNLFGFGLQQKPTNLKYEAASQPHLAWKDLYLVKNLVIRPGQVRFLYEFEKEEQAIESKLPGLYNVYNLAASLAVGMQDMGNKAILPIEKFTPVFGRGEKISIGDLNLNLFLVKNPAGFNQVLEFLKLSQSQNKRQIQLYTGKHIVKNPTVSDVGESKNESFVKSRDKSIKSGITGLNLVFLINDKIADGKDVSWLWDTELESFKQDVRINKIFTGGSRGLDMLLRLEYAGFSVGLDQKLTYFEDLMQVLSQIAKDSKLKTEPTEIYLLCTYTAMLQLRGFLQRKLGKDIIKDIDSQEY